jgi:SAM-dependent methyltransferase
MASRAGLGPGSAALEVGSGTGRLVIHLAELTGAEVLGAEPDEGMITQARAKPPPTRGNVRWVRAPAGALPLESGSLQLAYQSLVVHHLPDRAGAWREAHRLLRPGGLLCCWTFGSDHFRTFHLSPYFPSLVLIDRERFPTVRRLLREMRDAGFSPAGSERWSEVKTVDAGRYLKMVEGKAISTFSLLPADEYERGLRRLRAELGGDRARQVSYKLRWTLVWGWRDGPA